MSASLESSSAVMVSLAVMVVFSGAVILGRRFGIHARPLFVASGGVAEPCRGAKYIECSAVRRGSDPAIEPIRPRPVSFRSASYQQ